MENPAPGTINNTKARFKNLLLVLASVLLTLGLCEAFLRMVYNFPPIVSGWRFQLNLPHETNQLGFRGQSIKYATDDFVVVLLGDSNVESIALDFPDMPEKRLQHYLRALGVPATVISLGAGGYGQDQQLLVLEEYFRSYRADVVVLWQTASNDVWNNMFPTHWPANGSRKPTYRLEGGKLIGPNETMGRKSSRIKLIALVQRILDTKDKDGGWEKYLPEPYVPMLTYHGPVSRKWQERWDANQRMMLHENLANEKSHLALKLAPRSPRTYYGLRLTHRLLEEIERLAYANGAGFAIFSPGRPPRRSDNREFVCLLNNRYYRISSGQFEDNIRYMNNGFRWLRVPVTVKNWRVSPTDGHYNAVATDQIMRTLAGLLLQEPDE